MCVQLCMGVYICANIYTYMYTKMLCIVNKSSRKNIDLFYGILFPQ